ncbi:MAG: transposase [Betaproteobacteria bacterium]|nr:transposase [Betaproteobacteria bacterium]
MARPLRIEFPGAIYHVTARGDRREPIFQDDIDRMSLVEVFAQALERFDATALSFCLMDDHYHYVVQTRRANLSRLMRQVNGVYTQTYNRRHGETGHLFQGRFKAILVDRDAYLLDVCRHVELNPVRIGKVKDPVRWPWGSYIAHTGQIESPPWLDTRTVLSELAGREIKGPLSPALRRRYAQFVAKGHDVRLWEDGLRRQMYLGDDRFVKKMQGRLGAGTLADREIPRRLRQGPQKALDSYLGPRRDRNEGIVRAFREGGYTMSEIARTIGLSVSRVSRIVREHEVRDREFADA